MIGGAFDNPEMAAIGAVLAPRTGELWANLAGPVHGNLVMQEDGYQAIMFDATWDDELSVGLVEARGNGRRLAWSHQIVVLPTGG